MTKAIYYGVIHKDKDSDYGISFPDFQGCVSASKTVEEVAALAKEALNFHIEGMIEDKEPIPDATKPENFTKKYADAIAIVPIEVEVPTVKVKRFNVTAREDYINKIDNFLQSKGRSNARSEFLIQSAIKAIEDEKRV